MKLIDLMHRLMTWFDGPHGDEQYPTIAVKVNLVDEGSVQVSDALRGDAVPFLGEDHEKLLIRAMINYPTDELRIKWLQSLHKLTKSTKAGWVLKGGNVNWGLPVPSR